MTRLLRLYPRGWRARYGAELASILEARPPTLGDRVDLIRGAFDAHVHPELVDPEAEPTDPASGSVLAALLLGLGSVVWLVGVATVGVQPLGFGDRDASPLGIAIAAAGLLYAAGLARLVRSLRGLIGSAVIAGFALLVVPMTWPLNVIGFHGVTFGLATAALLRASAGRWPSWLAAVFWLAALIGLGTNVDSFSIWLATLTPMAMALLAVLSLFGRLPTGRPHDFEPEGAAT